MRPALVLGGVIVSIVIGLVGVGGVPRSPAALAQGSPAPQPMSGMGMMGGTGMMGGPFSPVARPLSMDQAVQKLREWQAAHHLDDLALDEVEAYTQNFYGQFMEHGTGRGAVQLLVDRYTGRVTPEMGPNMMWNSKYGHAMMHEMMSEMPMMNNMGMMSGMGMMGGAPAAAPAISEVQAKESAAQFLAGYLPGARVGGGDTFYGYYHFDVLRGIRQVGMLSVSAQNGQVWYHTWHGEFLEKREIR